MSIDRAFAVLAKPLIKALKDIGLGSGDSGAIAFLISREEQAADFVEGGLGYRRASQASLSWSMDS